MKKLQSFAGVALLALTVGVVGCDDDAAVTPVAPPPPPPPPVVVTMSPASQTIGVGGTVVFAVSVSGGVAGEAASWTCASSDPSKATVTSTSAGCAATAVAAGGVTITAAVTKGAATVNTAAGLTIVEDMAERATLFIAEIMNRDDGDEVLSRWVNVKLSVELGHQMPTQLSVLVDGLVVDTLAFGGASMVAMVAAAPEGEEGERAAQQAAHTFVLSFNSAEYDAVTGEPTYMNGEHTISARLMVASSDEPIESGFHAREFGNDDGVHVAATAPSESKRASDGGVWYGGPGTTLEITAMMVSYSGSSVDAVTMQGFCGADAASKDEAPYAFAPDCGGKKKTTADAMPEFDASVAEAAVNLAILNHEDDIFPINLDYAGPTAPVFKVNPNGREGGWINAAVNLTGKTGSSSAAKNGWLTYYDKTDDSVEGVGGYIPQLRYSTSDPGSAAAAVAATPSTALPGETTSASKICFIVTAMDLLGNESALPKADEDCIAAGVGQELNEDESVKVAATGYSALLLKLKIALSELGEATDATKEAAEEGVADARKALADNGLLGGVDITPPTAEFTRTSLGTNPRTGEEARMIGAADEFKVAVDDTRSGINMDNALIAELEIRDADGTKCVREGKTTSSVSACGKAFDGVMYDAAAKVALTNILPLTDANTGYYTFTAQAQDRAGNLSEEIMNVALSDTDYPARVSVRASASSSKPLEYTLDINVNDDLSVRDYFSVMVLGNAVGAVGAGTTPLLFMLRDIEQIDAYNAPSLTTDRDIATTVNLPFLGLQESSGDLPVGIGTLLAYTRDQAEAAYAMGDDGARARDLTLHVVGDNGPTATSGDGFAADVGLSLVVGGRGTPAAPLDDDEDKITFTATAALSLTDNPNTAVDETSDNPFKRVLFFALHGGAATVNDVEVPAALHSHWRYIGAVAKSDADGVEYKLEMDAGELADIMDDDDGEDYSGQVIAIGIRNDVAAEAAVAGTGEELTGAQGEVKGSTGLVGKVATPTGDTVVNIGL